MKLYCFGHSGHSYKIANYLNLAGIAYESIFVVFFNGEARSPDFLALNPMGEVPILKDGDLTLTQSGVILDYLVEKTGAFAPYDSRENWRWVLWDNHKLSSNIGTLRFFKNFLPENKRSEDVIGFLQGRVNIALKILEDALKNREFLIQETPTPADFSCASYLFYPEDFGFDRKSYPHIDAWLSRIEALDNWKHPYDLMPFDQNLMNKTPSAASWHQ